MSKSHNIRQLAYLISTKNHSNFFDARFSANHIFQGSRAVKDTQVVEYIKQLFDQSMYSELQNWSALHEFKKKITQWILGHDSNTVIGLEKYSADYSAGTTQSFDSFYFRHCTRRFRCYSGEYFYHLKTWISNRASWSFITDSDPIASNDAVVISMPFCDTGSAHPEFLNIIQQCESLNVPVLIDCCYYPISSGITLDLSAGCIDTVAFSISKAFPVANLRIGVRYTKDTFDGQKLHDSINYNNNLSAYIGTKIIEQFPCSYIYKRYIQQQKQVCEYFNLTASDSVLFAIGDSDWDLYSRKNLLNVYKLQLDPADFNNRISLVSIFDHWDLFEKIKNETADNI